MSHAIDLAPLALDYSDSDSESDSDSGLASGARSREKVLLFVHGFSHNRRVWDRLIGLLPPGFRCISVDLRGHGASPWSPVGDYRLEAYASDLPILLDRLGIERATVVGHSLGGNVSTLFTASAPERVESLILLDTGPTLRQDGVSEVLGSAEALLGTFVSRAQHREHLSMIHPNGDRLALDDLAAASLSERLDGRFELALDPGVLGDPAAHEPADDRLALATAEKALVAALRKLTCPVLVVRGGRSSILTEEAARRMTEDCLVDSRSVTLPDAGHALMIDEPQGLSEAITRFLERVADERSVPALRALPQPLRPESPVLARPPAPL